MSTVARNFARTLKENRTVQMNINHQTLFQPITKWTTRLAPGTVNETILKAAGIAFSEVPGPVHLGVPAGIGKTVFEEPENDIQYLRLEKQPPGSSFFKSAEKARSYFGNARKPILAVGLSAVRAGVKNEMREMAQPNNLIYLLFLW